jgi:hypothetical protein
MNPFPAIKNALGSLIGVTPVGAGLSALEKGPSGLDPAPDKPGSALPVPFTAEHVSKDAGGPGEAHYAVQTQPEEPAVASVGPWPESAHVSIFGKLLNPRFLRAKLDDGREVAFEIRRGCKYRRGQPVKCRRVNDEMAQKAIYSAMA